MQVPGGIQRPGDVVAAVDQDRGDGRDPVHVRGDLIVSQEAARSRRNRLYYTIAYIDVDNFKTINDTRGHAGGDKVLVSVARILVHNLRQTDTVARIGGDEFVLLLPETDAEHAQKAIDKLFARLNEAMRQKQIPVTFSMGVITFIDYLCPVDEMIQKTDRLMYEVKSSLKNDVRYEVDCICADSKG